MSEKYTYMSLTYKKITLPFKRTLTSVADSLFFDDADSFSLLLDSDSSSSSPSSSEVFKYKTKNKILSWQYEAVFMDHNLS